MRGRRGEGGDEVTGVLPCGSNLGAGQNAVFVALEGTGTYRVLFRRAFIRDEQVLADPLGDMVRRIKAGFILLQTGMGLGVTAACIDLMRESNITHGHTNKYLPKGPDDYAGELHEVQAEIDRLGATPLEQAPEYLRAVLQARLRVSELVLEAAQAALMHAGSRGYILGSPVNRRIREAQFAAIITPSIRHLRQELQKPELRVY